MIGVGVLSTGVALVVGALGTLVGSVIADIDPGWDGTQHGLEKAQPWVDYGFAQRPLFGGTLTGQQWQQLAVSGLLWFVLPMAAGRLTVRRAEVK